ncbi:MAG: apolipoprotein N-acyltransferase [Flavobacteriaceae bacterium]
MRGTQNPLILALASGLLLGFAWPTEGITLLIFIALVPLLQLELRIRNDNKQFKALRVFAYSYLSFLLWNLITTWWLIHSTIWGMAFANLCNSLFFALIFTLFYWVKQRLPHKSAYIFLVALWLAFEKLHLEWDFSWTWLNLGNVFSEKIYWIQWYEYTGTFGGSLWVWIINIWIFNRIQNHTSLLSIKSILTTLSTPLIAIALPIAFSLYTYQKVPLAEKKLNIALLQPNIDPYNEKYKLTNLELLEQLKDQMKPFKAIDFDYLLTPETYFAEGFGEELAIYDRSLLHQSIQKELINFPLTQWITGIQFYDVYAQNDSPSLTANKVREGLWVDYYNSALQESFQNAPEAYHKSKLVVGIENMPFKKYLKPLLGDVLIDLGGTVSSRVVQEKRRVFSHPIHQTQAAPIICWESVFGEFVTGYIREGAQFLAVISNDAWWENTPGHRQLLSYTKLRAIETRRAIARSANTGISAFINAKGEIEKQTTYNTKTVLTGTIAPRDKITFYVRYGDALSRIAILVCGLYLLLALSGRIRPNSKA